jgi:hypothetical protein
MATNQYGQTEWDADPETAAELRRLANQEKIAAAMAARGQVPLTGQMVGNTFVGASPLQGIANLLHQYNASKATQGAEQGYKALSDRKAQEYASAISDYKRNTVGTPEQPMGPPTPEGEMGVKEAVAPGTKQQITDFLLSQQHPTFKQAGLAQMLADTKQVEKFGHEVKFTGDKKPYVVGDLGTVKYLDPNVTPRDKAEFVNGTAVNPYTAVTGATPTVVPKQANPYSDLVVPGSDGKLVPNTPLIEAKKGIAQAGAAQTRVNTFTPASEEAQKDFMKKISTNWDALQAAPVTLKNIETAKGLVKQAGGFVGNFGENKLEIVKFFNNNLGTNIAPNEVANAEELRSRLFFQIMDNLKKMDSQPSQQQQQVMRESLGSLTTDPSAIPRVLDAFGDAIKGKVTIHNKTVADAEKRGVKFPFNPQIDIESQQKSIIREVPLKDGRIGVEYSDGTRGYK